MFLQAAFVPPFSTLEAIGHALQAAEPPAAAPESPPPRRGALGRLSGRAVHVAERPAEVVSVFALFPAGRLGLPIAGFGNVTMGDAIKVAGALQEQAEGWPRPTVHFAGAAVQEFHDRRYVALTMAGEVDELQSVARSVTQCVQRKGFRFDRRKFQPLLAVVTIGENATAAQVMGFLNALEGLRSEPWTVDHVSVQKRSFDATSMESMEYQRIPLGRH